MPGDFRIVQPEDGEEPVLPDDLYVQSLITRSLSSQQETQPDVWTFPVSGTVLDPPLQSLAVEPGSTSMVGNLDMSGQTFPNGATTTWHFGVIPQQSYGGTDVQMRVLVTPANVEAALLDVWVSDDANAISVQPTMPDGLKARAEQPNEGFIINIRNSSGAGVPNPNFNYFVATHPLAWNA